MTYGPNSNLVLEVLELAGSGHVLSGCDSLQSKRFVIERSLSRAQEFAWRTAYGDFTWSDVRSKAISVPMGRSYEIAGFEETDRRLRNVMFEVEKLLTGQLPSEFESLTTDVEADSFHCAYSRGVVGTASDFHEELFSAYRCGGWPCGLDGSYPSRRLIVFCPSQGRVGSAD